MRELPGYRHATRPTFEPIDGEGIERFRKRLEATWERDEAPNQTFVVFFRGAFAAYCEVVSCAKTLAVDVGACSYEGPGVRSTMTVTCTHEQLDRLKLAVKGCGVTDTAVRMLSESEAIGGRERGEDGIE